MTRRIIAAVAALLIALVGSLAVVSYARAADRRALAGQEAVHAFVAEKEVPAGTTAAKAVKEGLIVQKLIARKAVPDDVLTQVDGSYQELVATSTLQPGELVLRTRFAARGATQGALLVPEGLLAVSVALEDPSHVGPFVTVGAKVAVFDTFNIQEADKTGLTPAGDHLQDRHEHSRATRLLLPRVEVLAVGATTTTTRPEPQDDARQDGAGPQVDPTVATQTTTTLFTLAVDQQQAERLVHGSLTGTLTFALIGPEAKAAPGKGIDDRTLFEVTK
jgi:pilus assembly protein CpaB